MKKAQKFLKELWKDESAQGATEYILLLVVVVGIAILFKGKIMELVGEKIDEVAGGIKGITSN